MDKCKYYLDLDGVTHTFNSDQELTDFTKNNLEGTSKNLHVKFSKVDSGTLTKQEILFQKIKDKEGLDPWSKNFVLAEEFLGREHLINNQLQLLSPVFIDSNYIESGVADMLETDAELKELAKTNIDQAKKIAKEKIEHELELDNRMMKISIAMTSLLQSMINKDFKLRDSDIASIFKLVAEYNTFGEKNIDIDKYMKDTFNSVTYKNFRVQIEKWYSNISNSSNLFIAKVNLNKIDPKIKDNFGISSWASYISVSPEGTSDIYEIKVSRNRFKDWHSAKKIRTDYKLAINRQLLDNVTSTQSSSLFIQPIVFPEKGNKILLDDFFIDDLIDRSRYDSKAQLDPEGKITTQIRQLLPSKTKVDLEESSALNDQNKALLGDMFGKFNFRTKVINTDAEWKYNDIIKKAKDSPELYIWDINGVKHREPNTEQGRERFRKIVQNVVEKASKVENSQMLDLMKSILEAKKNSSEDRANQEIKFGKRSIELQRMFNKYLSPEWELIVDRPELLNGGLLVFKNNMTNLVEAVSITVNQLDKVNNLGLGNTVLGKFRKNDFYKHDSKVLTASNSNIETIKALTILNSNPSLLKGYKLNSIKVFDALLDKGDYINLDRALYNFNLLLVQVGTTSKVPIKNNFGGRHANIKVADFSKALYGEIVNSAMLTGNREFKAFVNQQEDIDALTTNKAKLDWFLKLREELVNQYRKLTSIDVTQIQDFSDPIEYLYYLVSSGITYYMNIDGVFDYDTPRYGMRTGDATHWARSLVFGSAPDYDENGHKIVGIFQGQHFNTTDALQSVYMTKLHDLITMSHNKIRSEFNQRKAAMIAATKEYYEEIGRTELGQKLLGFSDSYHAVLFDSTNPKDFILKNPWDPKSNLNDSQRKYLKKFVYFQYLSRKDANLQLKTLEQFEKSLELQKMLTDSSIDVILRVPLIKKQTLSNMKNLTTDGFWKYIGQVWDTMKNAVDVRDLTGEQLDEERNKTGAYESINGFKRMYNSYNAQESVEMRDGLIDKYGVGYFEVNLDTIGLKYTFESIREKHFNNVLPAIHAGLTAMKFYGWQTGKTKETQDALEDFFDQLKISVYNTSVIKNREVEEALGVVKSFQKVTSVMALAFRPVSMIKELVVGTIKNTSYAWSKIYGDDSFSEADLTKAYTLLFSNDGMFGSQGIISEINTEYGIANRDLNQIVDKVKVDRYGMNFVGNSMYWCNTFPDYINRLSLFVAKMIHDGCYEAHSINSEGQLVYDPSKDQRFSYYFNNREKYKYEFHKTDTKYNDQRSLYLSAIEEFNSEKMSSEEKELTEKDNIPKAYFTKQQDSIVTFSDTAYGYYNRERSPLIKHLPFGIVFGQFMTFWPAKVKYYFGKPGSNTKRGRQVHKNKLDPTTGEKIYYYVRYSKDEETGDLYREEIPESELGPNDPRAKAWYWEGDQGEGLMYSLAEVTRSLFTGDLDTLDPQKKRNAEVALHDLFVYLLYFLFAALLTGDSEKSKTDPTKMGQYELIAAKILSRSTNEFGAFTPFTGLSATPAFIKKLGDASADVKSFMSGKSDFESLLRNNVNFVELIPKSGFRY